MADTDITAKIIREYLSFDKDSGVFTWIKKPSQATKIGSAAGSKTSLGYIRIRLLGGRFMAHRLAWAHVYGDWPDGEIDHINGCGTDNSIANLRVLTRCGNQHSQHTPPRNSQTKVRGVSKRSVGFVARIHVDGSSVNLGTHKTLEEASAAYWKAKVQIHPEVVMRLRATAALRDVDLHYMEHA